MTYRLTVPATDGVYVRDVPDYAAYHQLIISGQLPTAGRMRVEYRLPGRTDWLPVVEAERLDISAQAITVAYGAIDAYRFTVSGVSGGGGLLDVAVISMETWPGIGMPPGVFTGDRAMTMQFYDEANKKRGLQWEASRLVTLADTQVYSIIRTGSKPVDLKSRSLGYTGVGVVGRIYKAPTYTGGTADPWFNMNPRYLGTEPEVQLLTGFTLTNPGTKCGADIFGIGPSSNQSRGATPHDYGSNRILDEPNTAYLLEIASLDPASQQVTARLEIYEGPLDLPR